MSLKDAFAEAGKVAFGKRCAVCKFLETLTPDDRKIVEDAMANKEYTGAGIERALRSEGYVVTAQSLRRHRNGVCNP